MRGINHDIERHVSRFGWHGSGCGICTAQTNCYSDDSLMPVATQLLCGDDGLTVLCSCGAAAGLCITAWVSKSAGLPAHGQSSVSGAD